MLTAGKKYSVEELVEANKDTGGFFFSKDTMRFFRSRVLGQVWTLPSSWLFITSDMDFGGVRKYNVREMNVHAHVVAPKEFRKYATAREAMAAAKRLHDMAWGKEVER